MHWHAPSPERPLPRHGLVRLDPAAWHAWLETAADDEPLLAGWAARDWPLIARRAMPGEQGVALGLPLPPAQGKRRVAVNVPRQAITAVAALPTLREAWTVAPSHWSSAGNALDALAGRHRLDLRVFGSLAWEYLTGLPYLSPGSDLDLAWSKPASSELASWLDALADIDAQAPMRIDGELIDTQGAGVNWRELHAGTGEVALKSLDGLQLVPRERVCA